MTTKPTELLFGKQMAPDYGIILGVAGVGKTSFIAGWTDLKTGKKYKGAPNCVMLGPENLHEADCAKFPRAETFEMLVHQINEILAGKHDKHGFKTVGIDSLDLIEGLIHKMFCERAKAQNIDSVGQYGAGRKATLAELIKFEELCYRMVREKGLSVWYVAHCVSVEIPDPVLGATYSNYELALHKSKKMDAGKVFVDKVSTILFANTKLALTKDGHAVSLDQRVLYTEFRPGHLAKNRYGLPYELPLFYEQYEYGKNLFYSGNVDEKALQNSLNSECEMVKSEINKIINENKVIPQETINNVNQAVSMANNSIEELKRILSKLETITN